MIEEKSNVEFEVVEFRDEFLQACKELNFEVIIEDANSEEIIVKLTAREAYRLGIEFKDQLDRRENRLSMLNRLTRSGNENVRILANDILSGKKNWRTELNYTGSFMTAVLQGNYQQAFNHADEANRCALSLDQRE